MTTVQRVAQVLGWIFLIVGVIGLYYARSMSMGMLLGLFPVNVLHNVAHIALGVWGIAAAKTFQGAKTFATVGGVIYLVLALIGYFVPMGFNIIPLGGNDVWLHVVLGVILVGAGFMARPVAEPVAA